MRLSESENPLRRAALGPSSGLRETAECYSSHRIWDAAQGDVHGAELIEIIDHAGRCDLCSLSWRLALQLRPINSVGFLRPVPKREKSLVRKARPAMIPGALAAAVLLGLGLALWPLSPDRQSLPERSAAPTYRGAGRIELQPLHDEGATLPRSDFVLGWKLNTDSQSGPPRFTIVVTDSDSAPIAHARDIRLPRLRIAEKDLSAIPHGALLFCTVEATLEDGEKPMSLTFTVRVG